MVPSVRGRQEHAMNGDADVPIGFSRCSGAHAYNVRRPREPDGDCFRKNLIEGRVSFVVGGFGPVDLRNCRHAGNGS